MNWYQLNIKEVFEITGSSVKGLRSDEAAIKLLEYGPNDIEIRKNRSVFLLLLNQFRDFMILVLIAAAIIAGIAADITDAIIILVIVILNALLGFVQEYRAEKAMETLRKIAALRAQVVRDGQHFLIEAHKLVPGDLVLLEAGNIVPADIRLIETHGLLIDESALTGESVPSGKTSDPLQEIGLSAADQLNMAFKTTLVTNGRAKGIVVATGMQTEIGLIARLLQQEEPATPLQKRMSDFGKKLSYIILFICVLLFIAGVFRGEKPLNMLLVSISLAVAAIPEALPALITIALSMGANRLLKKKALMRKLPAVETLGSVTYICSDKTGTLTQNRMKVQMTEAIHSTVELMPDIRLLEALMAMNHDVKASGDGTLMGDATEVALLEYFLDRYSMTAFEEIKGLYPRLAELPFDSDRKCMTTVHRYHERLLVVSKGAVESVVANLKWNAENKDILHKANEWAVSGIRVIAFAYKVIDELPEPFSYEMVESDLLFAGMAGMIDPPKDEVKQSIKECRAAGIYPVMITGDHPSTAAAIARDIGILRENDLVVTGKELQSMSDDEFENRVEKIAVYARVSPGQKLDIIKALQRKNHFVAMTGDGVNDAPSLRSANIGVAMGINGTDVSKEAAHMILLDDNFSTIVGAVKEGRRIYDNIRKFVKYIMTCNGAEIATLFFAPLIGLPIPLLPVHILWINLVTDGLPGLALASEKAEVNIMQRPPRKSDESLFSNGIGFHILWVGLLMAAVTLGIQAWAGVNSKAHWQTMVFTVLSLTQLGHVLAIRSESDYLYKQGLFSNLPLVLAVGMTFLLQLVIIYLPFANEILRTTPLSWQELLICIVASSVVFHAVEFEKFVRKRIG